jgi:hypothetical protein
MSFRAKRGIWVQADRGQTEIRHFVRDGKVELLLLILTYSVCKLADLEDELPF